MRKFAKSCKQCEKLADPDNFPKGAKVRIEGVYDCENCEVFKSQPTPENENAVELHNALPRVYDGMSGLQIITASDIKFVFEVYDVHKDLYSDYYQKIIYLHSGIIETRSKIQEKKTKEEEAKRKWKEKTLRMH